MHRSRCHHAFTLIELLVVISIIAAIISMLLPALASARQMARQIACSSNYRSLGQVMGIYVEDYDGHYIYDRSHGGSGSGAAFNGREPDEDTWTRIIRPYLGFEEDAPTLDDFAPAVPEVFLCPETRHLTPDPAIASDYEIDHVSPGYNWMFGSAKENTGHFAVPQDGRIDKHIPRYRHSVLGEGRLPRSQDVRQPYNTVLFADFFGYSSNMVYGRLFDFEPAEQETFVHAGGTTSTAVYADGSVDTLNRGDWGWGVPYATGPSYDDVPQPWNPW